MMRWLSLCCLMVPVVAVAAGLQPGEYQSHVNIVISGAPVPIAPQDIDRSVCVTAADIADNGRRFTQMQDPQFACELANPHFTTENATSRLICPGGVEGEAKSVWSGDHYTVQTHMTRNAGGMQLIIDTTITGKRTGDCSK